jgi:hypothetical protein
MGPARSLPAALTIVRLWLRNRDRYSQQFPATGQVLGPVAIAEQPVVADPLEAIRKDMQQEPPQEFIGDQGHRFLLLLLVLIVLAGKSD